MDKTLDIYLLFIVLCCMHITNVMSRVDTNPNNIVGTLFHWSTGRIQSTLFGLVINEKNNLCQVV